MEFEEAFAFEVVGNEGNMCRIVVGEAAELNNGEEDVLIRFCCVGLGMEGVLVRMEGELGVQGKSEVLWSGGLSDVVSRCFGTREYHE